jgi:PucR family transcriptional regulator, purine catabolism regulatory protein
VSGAGAGLRVGVGRVVTEPLDVRRSCSEAALAMGAAPGGPIGRYDDLDLGTLVLQELQLERLAPKIDAWLEPLRETPRVFETLVAYFDNNLDVGRTAEALHLHPNSVRYRLARAEELIGTPVRSPSTMIALHVAMAAQGQRPSLS